MDIRKSNGKKCTIKTKLLCSTNKFEIVIWVIWKINAIDDTIAIEYKLLSPGFFENFSMIKGIKAKIKAQRIFGDKKLI